jgi:hypothetical protein
MLRLPGTVSFDEHSEVKAAPATLKALFRDRGTPILISGEGGIGKTSLAMQMCRWAMDDTDPLSTVGPMIPVFFQATQPLGTPLLADISHQLRTLSGDEALPDWLVRALLANGRVLVVFDDISERMPSSTQQIYRAQKDLPISAMIVTRRHDDPDLVPCKHIEVREFRADQIQSFLETYFKERDVALPAATTSGELAARFGELTDRHTNSAFFLKLFCDQMIDSNFAATRCNLVTLVRSYVTRVNRHRRANEPDDEGVYRLYGAFACTSLEANQFGTGPISRRAAAAALGDDPSALDYLVTRLRLVSPDEDDRDQLRCTAPTLGLYVAAMTYADRCGSSIEQWESLIGRVASAKESGIGLAVALHHVLSTVQGASPRVRERIAAIAGLDLPLEGEAIPGTDYVVGDELPIRVPHLSNFIRYRLYEVHRAGDPSGRARGKRYDLTGSDGQSRVEMLHNAQRHAEVCDRLRDAAYIHRYRIAAEDPAGRVLWVVEDWIEGRSLLDRRPRDRQDHGRIMQKVAQGMRSLHEREVYVRRLTPASVLINSRTGDPVLTDFELAQIAGARSVAAGTRLADQPYVAPERRLDPSLAGASREFRERADVYVWGALYAYLLTGQEPDTAFVRNAKGLLRDAQVEERTAQLVLACLRQSARDRPASMAEVMRM